LRRRKTYKKDRNMIQEKLLKKLKNKERDRKLRKKVPYLID
jgi:hypothetical protein